MTNLTYIQANGLTATVNVTSSAISFPINTSSKSLLLAYCIVGNGSTGLLTGITDNLGNTWQATSAAGPYYIYFVPQNAVGGGATTVTFHFSAANQTFLLLGVVEYTGQNTSGPIDILTGNLDSTGTAYTGVPVTSRQTNETIVGMGFCAGNATLTGTGGFTKRADPSTLAGASFAIIDAPATAIGTYTPTCLVSPSAELTFNTIALVSTSSQAPTAQGSFLLLGCGHT